VAHLPEPCSARGRRATLLEKPAGTLKEPSPVKDFDVAARARAFTAAVWAGGAGFVLGFFMGLYLSVMRGWPFLPSAVGLGILLAVALTGVTLLLSEGVGFVSRKAIEPSGRSTPYRQQFSRAQSLEVRERFGDAVAAYREHIEERPTDPEPYVRIARIYRDRLGESQEAIRWFKDARAAPETKPSLDALITREIVDLYATRLGEPARAAPELARMAERHEGTPAAAWATEELRRIKQQMREDEGA